MTNMVLAGGLWGLQAYPVRVEVDMAHGLPFFELVGSLGTEVKEGRERVRIALKNAGISLPAARFTVNLSPADIRKEGTAYDLAIAVGLLACMEVISLEGREHTAFLGELTLNGEIRPVNGVLPIVLALKKAGVNTVVIPFDNLGECEEIPEIAVVGLQNIKELLAFFEGSFSAEMLQKRKPQTSKAKEKEEPGIRDFADVYGQESAKQAALTAAAGGHHLLLFGPPGAGKTMIAERIAGILPLLSKAEQIEVTGIYSIAGKLKEGSGLFTKRPFVTPHHTVSYQAFAGGGSVPRPGLLTMAHRGVLFLDEMPEFPAHVLEALRQPMEEKQIQISRSRGTFVYPADFMLVCAMNPCPCGFFPDRNRCRCSENEIRKYLSKISGPILDRMDIVAETSAIKAADLKNMGQKSEHPEYTTARMREKVMEAREIQQFRYRDTPYATNGELKGRDTEVYCRISEAGQGFLEQVYESGRMSARGYHKVLRLARTIADLDNKPGIELSHLAQAVFYNHEQKGLWSEL